MGEASFRENARTEKLLPSLTAEAVALVIVPALSTVEGPPLVEAPSALIERPVKLPVIVAPTELMTVEPPPIKAPLEPAVMISEFVRVDNAQADPTTLSGEGCYVWMK